jgi:anti-sigma-K factor RskA
MTCEELRDEYGAYALGIAEDPERAEIAEHLARNCSDCVPGVRKAMAMVTAMSSMDTSVEPPKDLRGRVIGMVERGRVERGGIEKPAKRSFMGFVLPWAACAAMAVALLAVVLPSRRPNPDTAKLAQALAILNDPDTKQVTFGETARPSRGRVFVSGAKGVLFIGASLPAIAPGKTFELWVIPAKGNPVPAGTFGREADATAVYVRPGPVQGDAAAMAVTVEPEGGSPQPTTTPFLVMKLNGA